jgi:hypothetical protein
MSRVNDYRKENKGGDYSRVEALRHGKQPRYSDDSVQPQMFRLSRPGFADTYSRTLRCQAGTGCDSNLPTISSPRGYVI